MSVLAVSCSNADKTGSGDNNSGNGGTGTGGIGDGGTTPQGIAKYEGTWQPTAQLNRDIILIISSDSSVSIEETNKKPIDKSTDVTDKGNETYEVKFVGKGTDPVKLIFTLKFDNDTSGTCSISDGQDTFNGTIRKQ